MTGSDRRPTPPRARKGLRALAAGGVLAGSALVAAAALSCGANDVEAPARRMPAEASLQECRNFDQLMPRFHEAMETGKTEGLRVVMEEHVLQSEREGEPPPINNVLRTIFVTLNGLAAEPPEPGAREGEVCADPPPPLALAHPMCEMRRAMDVLHDGKGLVMLEMVDPLLASTFDYVRGANGIPAHYEVSTVLHDLCRKAEGGLECRTRDTLDLVIALVTYMQSPEGREALNRTAALVEDPALEPFLRDDGSQYGGEEGIVALAHVVLQAIQSMDDPSDLDSLPIDALPDEIEPEVRAGLEDVKSMLSPTREPNILEPLKKVIHCYRSGDKGYEVPIGPDSYTLIRMLYRLGLEYEIPEFGLTTMMKAVTGVRDADERGSLLHAALILARAVRSNEQAMDDAAQVCQALFSTDVAPGESRSPAELALPVVADLFHQGVAQEAMCAIDTLIYGCAGGEEQLACQSDSTP